MMLKLKRLRQSIKTMVAMIVVVVMDGKMAV